mgnify:FL=1
MRMKSKEYVASNFDAQSAPQPECEFIGSIISGEKRAFSLPQALDLHQALKEYPNTNGMKSQNA